jgi:hypothetical protein
MQGERMLIRVVVSYFDVWSMAYGVVWCGVYG